ncbi:MAG: hypothetical protein DDT38_00462 [Firmicutes bacterium]|nr:hypothetical protein [candidate division NPL-UPA2 bacterium]
MRGVIIVLHTYDGFVRHVNACGFMPFSGNRLGLLSLADLTDEGAWHTNEETDPWVWRKKIAEEKIAAYGKLFAKKPGFISLACYPYFLALRRGAVTGAKLYSDGKLNYLAKTIYDLFLANQQLAAHEIPSLLRLEPERKSAVENALTELQMYMLVTTCGVARKTSPKGEEYGWPAVVYTAVENWLPKDILLRGHALAQEVAKVFLLDKAREMLPRVDEKKLLGFLDA